MATFEITSPDGATYQVTAPEGATNDQIMQYVQMQSAPSPNVGGPANGMKYTPAQMAQLNAARAPLLAAEASGLYGPGGTGSPLSNAVQQQPQANPDAALGGTLRFGVPFTNLRLDTGLPLPAGLEAGIVGAGKTASDLVNGVRQMLPGSNANLDRQVKADNAAFAPLQAAHPVSTFVGEAAPYLAAGNSIPALMALSAAGYGSPEERATRAAFAGAGGAVGKGVARLFGPSSMAPAAADAATNPFGIPTTVGMNGNKTAQLAESVIANLPFVNGTVNNARTAAFQAFNRAAAQTMGEDATQLTPELAGQALNRSGQQIGDIMGRANAQLTPQQAQAVAGISNTIADIPGPEAATLSDRLGRLVSGTTNGQTLTGQQLRMLDSSLGRIMGSTQNGDAKYAAAQLQNVLRDAASASLSPDDAAALTLARQQNFNARQIADAMAQTPGSLSPSRLLTQVNNYQQRARYGGGNNLADLAQFAKPTLSDSIPNSGTPQRMFIQKLLTNPLTGLAEIGGIAYGANETGHPALAGSTAALLPLLIGRGLAGVPASMFTRGLLTGGFGGSGALLGGSLSP